MSDKSGESPKFDKEAWEKAYREAGDLPPEPVDFNKPEEVKDFLQNALDEAGATGPVPVMSGKEIAAFWKQQELNLQNLILAELGDDTVVMITGKNGTRYLDIASAWSSYINLAMAYKRGGDQQSVEKLLSIFPEHSQLQLELERKLDDVEEEDRRYRGFDVREGMGKVEEVKRGNQYDLLPGAVDFRKYTQDKSLNIDGLASGLFGFLESKGEAVYAEDWNELNLTLDNVEKEFGREVRDKVWDVVAKRYRDKSEG